VTLLAARGITHHFGAHPALVDLDLRLAAGELLVVVGPNGAGKTTLLRVLSGALAPEAGSVELDAAPLPSLSRRDVAQRLAVAAQEEPAVFPYTVEEVVAMGRAPFLGPFGREGESDRRIVHEALDHTGMRAFAERRYPTLSSGERQRVVLARALAQTPRVMLLDEPTAHMDLGHRVKTFENLRAWIEARSSERAVLVVTHDLVLAARYADRMLLLDAGREAASGTPREVLRPETVGRVYGVDVEVSEDATGRPVVVAHHSRIDYTRAPMEPDR
jgi:iron complex transport system ATP-binding protein